MGIPLLEKLFPAKAAITSDGIVREIDRANAEIEAQREKLASALAGVSTMTDEQHQAALVKAATIERAITRLVARAADLGAELPGIRANEEKAARVAADRALRDRAEACRKANTVEAKKLLADYDRLASQMGDIFQRLNEIADERNAVNKELSANPVADNLPHWHDVYRKQPDRQAFERRELRPAWVFSSGDVVPARTDSNGKIIQEDARWNYHLQRLEGPRLEQRDIVVERGAFRPGMSGVPLPTVLAAGFSGGKAHWPRS